MPHGIADAFAAHRRPSRRGPRLCQLQLLAGALPFPNSPPTSVHLPAQHWRCSAARPAGCHRRFLEHVDLGPTVNWASKQRGGRGRARKPAACCRRPARAGDAHRRCPMASWLVMGDVDHRRPRRRDRAQWGPQLLAAAGRRGCFIGSSSREPPRAPQQGPSQGHPLALAPETIGRAAFAQLTEPCSKLEHARVAAWWPHRPPRICHPQRKVAGPRSRWG